MSPEFGERVIYLELFPMGLAILDLLQPQLRTPLSMSRVAARQEVGALAGLGGAVRCRLGSGSNQTLDA